MLLIAVTPESVKLLWKSNPIMRLPFVTEHPVRAVMSDWLWTMGSWSLQLMEAIRHGPSQ